MHIKTTRQVQCPSALSLITTPGLNAVFLEQQVSASLQNFIRSAFATAPSRSLSVTAPSGSPQELLQNMQYIGERTNLRQLRDMGTEAYAELWQSICRLVAHYQGITGSQGVTVGLHMNGHHTPIFHIDGYAYLVTQTLLGEGTLWLPSADVDETGRQGYTYPQQSAAKAQQVPTGWITAKRGYLGGLVHSSPQTKAGTRLFVVVYNREQMVSPYLG